MAQTVDYKYKVNASNETHTLMYTVSSENSKTRPETIYIFFYFLFCLIKNYFVLYTLLMDKMGSLRKDGLEEKKISFQWMHFIGLALRHLFLGQ